MRYRYIGIIPARYASTRFPGKPLADLCGHPVIEHVYRRVSKELDDVWVATDDMRIAETVRAFGGKAVMTSLHHRCGTDRCNEAYGLIGSSADIVINIQGDEPFISSDHIDTLIKCMESGDADIATLAYRIDPEMETQVFSDPNRPKVLVDSNMYASGFQRRLPGGSFSEYNVYQHIGIYAFRGKVLPVIATLPQSESERVQSLEQCRWLDAGYRIKVGIMPYRHTVAIDTPDDLERARGLYEYI